MTQDLQPINTELEVNAQEFTAQELSKHFGVTVRAVYKYINTIIDAYYWLPESSIKNDGKYTQFCFDEITRLKACKNATEYKKLVAVQNQKPITQKHSNTIDAELVSNNQPTTKAGSLALPERKTDILESRLARIQSNQLAQNTSIQDRVKLALSRIGEEKTRSAKNNSALDDARLQAAKLKAAQDALEEHEVYLQTKNAIREQLLLEELGE